MSASPGAAGRRISSTRREPAAKRRRQRRRHGRRRVGRRQVGGHRLDDRDPRVGGRLQRHQPVVVADEGDRPLGQLGGERLVLGAPDDVERRLVEAVPASGAARPAGASPQRRRRHRSGPAAAPARGPSSSRSSAGSSAVPSSTSSPARRAAMASTICAEPWARARMSRASLTVTPSNRSCPRSRSRRTAADRLVGRSSLAGQREVAGHDHPRARAQCRSERDQLPLGQLGVRPGHERQLVVRIRCRVAGAREVLGRRGHAPVLQAADGRRREPSDGLGIVAEAADPERRIGRVVGHVAHRRVVDVDPEGAQLARRRAGDALGQPFVAGRPERHRAGELASSRRPARSAGRPPGRRQRATAAHRPAVPPGSPRSAPGSGADRRRCGRGRASPRRRHCSLIRLAADRRQLGADEGDHEPRQGHDLTEPARIPLTNARWSSRKTSSGTIMVMNAPAVRRCHEPPRLPIML